MFSPDLLRDVRLYLHSVETGRQAEAQSDRERAAIQRGESSDAIRFDMRWFDLWRNPTPHLLETISPFTWVIFPIQVRHMRGPAHLVPWHQDIGYQRLLGDRCHRRLITCFVPLDDDPSCRPTVEFARVEAEEIEHISMNDFGAALKSANYTDVEHFKLQLGNCLLFGELAVHRTFIPENAVMERTSFEFRLVRPEDALDNKDYFDVETGLFVRTDGSTRKEI